ncbi:MAG: hypothetical protein WCP85_29840 [Mariniphaga sp.]
MKPIITINNHNSRTKKSMVLIVLLFFISLSLSAQNDYALFKFYDPFKPDSTGKFYLSVDNVNFFKNNEYNSKVTTGYTLPGAWLRPKLVYYPDEKLRVEFGGHVLKFNGREEYFHLTPWLNVHYQATEKISIILGNLNSDGNHKLIEPLFEPERFLTSKPEAGLQLRYNSKKFTTDFWIDWQQYIVNDDPLKEQFAFGTVINQKLIEKNNMVLSLPVSFYGLHRGGEIDTNPDPVKTYITVTPGLSFKEFSLKKIIREWGINSYYSLATYAENIPYYTMKKGWGFYSNAYINTRYGGLTFAYWHGHQFFTPQGGYLYQCISKTDQTMLANNKLLNLKYHYMHKIMEDTYFGFIYDAYYDAINKKSMSSQGLYLIVNFGVSLKKGIALP